VRKLVVWIATSKAFRIAAASAALIAGLDDLIEAYFGVKDLFGLDVAHGVVITALQGILDPLSKLILEGDKQMREMAKEGNRE
jgi:hypothetical protein